MYTLEGYNEILAEQKVPIDTGRVMVIGFSSGGMGVRAAMIEYLQSGGAFTPATLVCASTTASIGRTKYPPVPYVVMAGEKETAEHMKHPLLKTRRSTCRKHAVAMQQVFREVRYIEMQGRGHGAGSPEHQAVFLNLLRALPAWRIKLSLSRVPPELEPLVALARSADWIALKRALATLDRAKHWQRELAARSRYYDIAVHPPSEELRADLQALLEELPETEFGGNRVKEKLLALQG